MDIWTGLVSNQYIWTDIWIYDRRYVHIYICPPWAIVQAIVIYAEPNLAKD